MTYIRNRKQKLKIRNIANTNTYSVVHTTIHCHYHNSMYSTVSSTIITTTTALNYSTITSIPNYYCYYHHRNTRTS